MFQTIYQVDAFTDRPYTGNPAAVCILEKPRDDKWMQNVALEMNLSETAFLHKEGEDYRLRWFTPEQEVKLCGHATLASAHILWEEKHLPSDQKAIFHTLSGVLTARSVGEWIELEFPSVLEHQVSPPTGLAEALGVSLKYVGKNEQDYLVEVASEKTVRGLQPNLNLLQTIPARGIIVTSLSDSGKYDFISRFFAPRAGVNEDPVTGSAHCCLGPFWGKLLKKDRLKAYQASSRGGVIHIRLDGERVYLKGQAITMMRSEFLE
ncbi:MAG: phenazine biosynthesis protein [bacterium]|nr:MAG: phenazine biosynthesis protein [bacterium]